MSRHVLDASALLALVNQEPGSEVVHRAISDGASICAVNLCEVVGKLLEIGIPEVDVRQAMDLLNLQVVSFDADLAYLAGALRGLTRQRGLSLADRACLALGQRTGLPILTADRAWQGVQASSSIVLIR